jgi:hypothetical protein
MSLIQFRYLHDCMGLTIIMCVTIQAYFSGKYSRQKFAAAGTGLAARGRNLTD